MGRRAHQPDTTSRRQVEAMAGYGIREADIACVLDIDPKTLRRHYRKELDKGHIKATTMVAENLYRKATGEGREAVTAAIFWLKTRAGWRETVETKSEVRYVARLPAPINDVNEWLRIYAPKTIEHQPPSSATPAAPSGLPPLRLIRSGDG
jgi:hypothetical protein